MRKITMFFCLIALTLYLCGCGQSNTLAQERRAAELEETTDNIKATESVIEDTVSENSTSSQAVDSQEIEVSRDKKQESIVWVKDTETVRNMETGEVTRWKHEVKLNDFGLVVEDYATAITDDDTEEQVIIKHFRYDDNMHCIWESECTLYGGEIMRAAGHLWEYDNMGNMIVDAYGLGMDKEEWDEELQSMSQELQDLEIDSDDIGEDELELIVARMEEYKKYTWQDTYISEDNQTYTLYFPPFSYFFEYEYETDGKLTQSRKISGGPSADIIYLYDYEKGSEGYIRTGYLYQKSQLIGLEKRYFNLLDQQVRVELLNLDGSLWNFSTTSYNENGNVIEQTNEKADNSPTKYSYDEYGNLISEKFFSKLWNASIPLITREYTYKTVVIQR